MTRLFGLALTLVASGAAPSFAQAGAEHVRIIVDGGAQLLSPGFGQDFSLETNAERMPVSTTLAMRTSPVVDGGARIVVYGKLSLGGVGFVG